MENEPQEELELSIPRSKLDECLGLDINDASPINLVDAMLLIARGLVLVSKSIKSLGNGGASSGPPGFEIGALEFLGMTLKESMEELVQAIREEKGGA